MKRVVVTGLGCLSAAGNNVGESWENILQANSGIKNISSFDTSSLEVKIGGEVSNFDPRSFLSFKETKNYSRFVQFSIAASLEALKDAQLPVGKSQENYGCSIGVGLGDLNYIDDTSKKYQKKGPKNVSPFFVPYVIANMAAGNTAKYFSFKGPNICPTTACASGTHAIGEAWLYIMNDYADVMLCGGSESVITPLAIAGFSNMKALSRSSDKPELVSKPFDKDRSGFVLGEGAGILVLESLEHAEKRNAKIYAEVLGYGMSADAYHLTAPAPRGEGAKRCMISALKKSNISIDKVQYINAHGTSTYYNDLYESQAIEDVFKDHIKNVIVSSTKGVTGHCLGAAGGIEGVVLAKSIYHQIAPPTANLNNQDPLCTLNYAPLSPIECNIDVGLSNSFGFGGTNATIVMKKF